MNVVGITPCIHTITIMRLFVLLMLFLEEFGVTAVPFLIRMLPACMILVGANNSSISQFSETYCRKLYTILSPEAFIMPTQVNEMTVASVLISLG